MSEVQFVLNAMLVFSFCAHYHLLSCLSLMVSLGGVNGDTKYAIASGAHMAWNGRLMTDGGWLAMDACECTDGVGISNGPALAVVQCTLTGPSRARARTPESEPVPEGNLSLAQKGHC